MIFLGNIEKNNLKKLIQIGVIGDSQIRSIKQQNIAFEIGREIANSNAILICGGRGGVMEAACKGVFESNGISVGILPTDESDPEVNKYLTIRIPTYLHWGRNFLIPLASDGVIAIGGSVGTLSEISYTWMYNKPLVCITSVSGWSKEFAERGRIDNEEISILTAEDGKTAVKKILLAISRTKK